MAGTQAAYDMLRNGSILEAGFKAYESSVGIWFWPLFFIFTLTLIHIKTENPAYIFFYALLGNVLIGAYILPITHPIFYSIAVFSFFLVLWKIFGSKKTE